LKKPIREYDPLYQLPLILAVIVLCRVFTGQRHVGGLVSPCARSVPSFSDVGYPPGFYMSLPADGLIVVAAIKAVSL
jgi:hypothetical protein